VATHNQESQHSAQSCAWVSKTMNTEHSFVLDKENCVLPKWSLQLIQPCAHNPSKPVLLLISFVCIQTILRLQTERHLQTRCKWQSTTGFLQTRARRTDRPWLLCCLGRSTINSQIEWTVDPIDPTSGLRPGLQPATIHDEKHSPERCAKTQAGNPHS